MTFNSEDRFDPPSAGTASPASTPSPATDPEPETVTTSLAHRAPTRFPIVPVVAGALALATASYFVGRAAAPPPVPTAAGAAAGTSEGADAKPDGGGAAAESGGDKKAGSAPITLQGSARETAGIKVASAVSSDFGESLTVPGTVQVSPDRGAKVTPQVAGTVISLLAAPGDRVRAGQPLAVMDSPDVAEAHAAVQQAESAVSQARAQVQSAEAGVQQAVTKLGSTQAALQRQRDLARTGAFSQPSLQAAQGEFNAARSELTQAQTDVNAQTVIVARNERLLKDQLVARAELEQSQVAQQQAKTRAAQAQARLAIARQTLEREQKVFQGGLLSKQPVQAAEADVRAAQGDARQTRKQEEAARTGLEGAVRALAAVRANLRALEGNGHAGGGAGRIVLVAPLAGVIAQRSATAGQAVERSSDLFLIQNLQAVTVEAAVPEASVARVRAGAPVEVTVAAYPGKAFAGVVQSVGSDVDEKSRALPVRCLVGNARGALKPGMFAKVTLRTGNSSTGRRAVTVPDAAVDEDGEDRFVYVQSGADAYAKRPVKVGRSSGGRVEILMGVKPGEKVVTDGMFVLKSESKKGELKGDD